MKNRSSKIKNKAQEISLLIMAVLFSSNIQAAPAPTGNDVLAGDSDEVEGASVAVARIDPRVASEEIVLKKIMRAANGDPIYPTRFLPGQSLFFICAANETTIILDLTRAEPGRMIVSLADRREPNNREVIYVDEDFNPRGELHPSLRIELPGIPSGEKMLLVAELFGDLGGESQISAAAIQMAETCGTYVGNSAGLDIEDGPRSSNPRFQNQGEGGEGFFGCQLGQKPKENFDQGLFLILLMSLIMIVMRRNSHV